MYQHKLIVYSPKSAECPLLQDIFDTQYEAKFTYTKEQFLVAIERHSPDGVIACFCSAGIEEVDELLELNPSLIPKPFLTCSEKLTLDFVSTAAKAGLTSFLCCRWGKEKIQDSILKTIQCDGIKDFIVNLYPNSFDCSPHIHKIVDEIIRVFPNRINEKKMAKRLGISMSWLQKLIRKAFNLNFYSFRRLIWVQQALCMMKQTRLDNTEIASYLNYSEESSMARDFRKELGFSPTEIRKRLINEITTSITSSTIP